MLRALGDPVSFLLLVVSFLIAVTAHGWASSVAADRTGNGAPRAEGRLVPDPRRHVDPFGAVAGLIAGIGWAKPVDLPARTRRGALLAVTLSGAVLNLLLGIGALIAVRVLAGAAPSGSTLLQYGVGGDLAPRVALLFGLMNVYVGILSLVPLPPLDGGRLLFGLAPRTSGWQKAEYQLVEQNIGIVALLVLLLIPLGGATALLPALLDTVVDPLVRLVTGG
ncbi:MAG: site-2 protease family protein [Actinobacteria bacterium]|nr:site-2 protease family protein [Actinomycetota bacterium]